MRRRLTTTILLITTLLLLPLATNIATGALPDDVRPYLWLAWPVALALVAVTVVIEVRKEKGAATVDSSVAEAPKGSSEPTPEQALRVHARVLDVHRYGASADAIKLEVRNDSDGPIFDVVAKVPGGRFEWRSPSMAAGVSCATETYQIDMLDYLEMFGRKTPETTDVGVSFVDKNGVRWKRIGHRMPTVLPAPAPSSHLFPSVPLVWGKRPPP